MYQTNEEIDTRMDLSVGEDLETFIKKIKNGEMNENESKLTFLLCSLDPEDRKKLDQKDLDFLYTFSVTSTVYLYRRGAPVGADVGEAEWNASESNTKFAKSECRRYTYFIDA